MHQHKCSLCGTMWQHGEELDRDMLAHECSVCGCHQFRVFKEDGGHTAALPEQTHDKLVAAFASADPFVRSTTLFALNVGDQAARGVLPNLATMATADPETMVRLAAVETLRRFGADAVAALPALSQALVDRHPEVRRAAALTLGDLGTAAQSAVDRADGPSERQPSALSNCSCRGFGKDSIRIAAVDRDVLVLARHRPSFGDRSIADPDDVVVTFVEVGSW